MPTAVNPSPRFLQHLNANLQYWLTQTNQVNDRIIARLNPDLPNVIQAITIGLICPETYPLAGKLLTQCFLWAEGVGSLARWQTLLEKSLEDREKLPPAEQIVQLKQLSQCYRHQGKLEDARHCLETAVYLTGSDPDPLVQAELHINMSQILRHKHLFPEAEMQARLALDLLPSTQIRLQGIARQTLGFIAQAVGEHAKAETHFRAALSLTYPEQKLTEQTRTMNALTHSLHALGRTEEALELYQVLTELLQPTPYTLDKLEVGINWGALLYSLGDLDEAETIFRQTESVANMAEGMTIPKAHLANNIGCVLRDKKAWHSAEVYLKRSLALWQKVGDPFFIIKSQLNLTKLYLQSEKLTAVKETLEQAQTLIQQNQEQAWAAALLADLQQIKTQQMEVAGEAH